MTFLKIFRSSALWLVILLVAAPIWVLGADSGGGKHFKQEQAEWSADLLWWRIPQNTERLG